MKSLVVTFLLVFTVSTVSLATDRYIELAYGGVISIYDSNGVRNLYLCKYETLREIYDGFHMLTTEERLARMANVPNICKRVTVDIIQKQGQ